MSFGLIAPVATILLARPPFVVIRALSTVRRDILFHVTTKRRLMALSFDDGPQPELVRELLDVLDRHHARATFFLIGSRATQHPEAVRAIVDAGHEVGNHMWLDQRSACQSDSAFERDLVRTKGALPGPVPLMRPGGGWIGRRKVRLATRHGYRCVLGSLYPYDAQVALRPRVIADLSRRARPGSVIVLHERTSRPRTAAAVDVLLTRLAERGFSVVTVSELLELEADPFA